MKRIAPSLTLSAILLHLSACGFIGYDPRPQSNSLASPGFAAGVDAATQAAVAAAASIPAAQRAFSAPGRPTGPVLLYLFDEGQGQVVLDRSGVDPAYDLAIIPVNGDGFTWQSGSLKLDQDAVAKAITPAHKLVSALANAQAASFEMWFAVASGEQVGNPNATFLALGSSATEGDMLWHVHSPPDSNPLKVNHMLRHRSGAPNGAPNQWGGTVGHVLNLNQVHHVVVTHAANGDRILYLNGAAVTSCNDACDVTAVTYNVAPGYNLWQTSHALHIGNEAQLENGWRGSIHLVAIYDRALSATEVSEAFAEGPDPEL